MKPKDTKYRVFRPDLIQKKNTKLPKPKIGLDSIEDERILQILSGYKTSYEELNNLYKDIIIKTRSKRNKNKINSEALKDYTPKILELTKKTVNEITRDDGTKQTLDDYIKMIEKDPFVKSCCELKALRATIAFGKYEHPNKDIQKWVQTNIDNMESSLHMVVGQLCSAMPLGFAVGEILFAPRPDKTWGLKGINILDPRRVSFEGKRGNITFVRYRDKDDNIIKIPYKKCIHVTAGYTTNFNSPYGSAECKRAYPYYQAKQTVLAEMTIAAKNNATGVWLGFTDSNSKVQIYGPNGLPLKNSDGTPMIKSSMEALMKQLQNIENNAVIVTDLNNRIESIQTNAGEGFWSFALTYLNQGIAQAFNIPMDILGGSQALWNGSLNFLQKSVLDATIEAIVKQIKDEFLEKIIKPLLFLNFGKIEEVGDFNEVIVNDPTTKAAHMQNLITAVSMQLVDGTDLDVQNKIRDLLDLPELKGGSKKVVDILNKQKAEFLPEIKTENINLDTNILPQDMLDMYYAKLQNQGY